MTEPRRPPVRRRIARRFESLAAENRAGLVTFIMAGDPTPDFSLELMKGLPAAGADLIELGMAFTDPMADGPAIQAAGLRALKAGITLQKTLEMVRAFRAGDDDTPIICMGYFNPIYKYGVEAFLADAVEAGVDGLIVVDLPPEEDEELCLPALSRGMNFIRLATPTTDDRRLSVVLQHTSGFVYYVSIAGITGTQSVPAAHVAAALERIRRHTDLPVAVGFGIKTPLDAGSIAAHAEGVVVGSAIVDRIAQGLDDDGRPASDLVDKVLSFVASLATGVKQARS